MIDGVPEWDKVTTKCATNVGNQIWNESGESEANVKILCETNVETCVRLHISLMVRKSFEISQTKNSCIKLDYSPPFPSKKNKEYIRGIQFQWSQGVQPLINQAAGSATCCAVFVAPLVFTSGRFFCGDVAPLPLERVVRRRPLAGRLPFMVDLSDFLRERTRRHMAERLPPTLKPTVLLLKIGRAP